MSEIAVTCRCGHTFPVPESLRGGLAQCPGCGKAAAVRGGAEPLFWALLSVGVAAVLGISAALWALAGPLAGGIAFGVGAVVLGGIVLAS